MFIESSLNDLYRSAVDAFPRTTKRQHATNPIVITNLNWIPFLGVKTLFVKGLAQNEGREHNPIIIFKNVQYREEVGQGRVEFTASDGQEYVIDKLSLENQQVLVRCGCGDFFWRFNFWDHLDKSLQGRKRKKYEALYNPGSANPQELPGMCKHLLKMVKVLQESGIIE